ncbi:ECF transporter S component [Christensenellaceae bacterium OttesenSCG-928-K19]|nr:ECF transporter S component [Christensenellaceae bacterium OttesenSCG-928-K19]
MESLGQGEIAMWQQVGVFAPKLDCILMSRDEEKPAVGGIAWRTEDVVPRGFLIRYSLWRDRSMAHGKLIRGKKITQTQYITRIAILAVVAFALMYIEFPIPIAPPWLKLDFSDVPALLGGFALGPVAGIIIQGIKCILFFFFKNSGTGGVGELANFLIGIAIVIPAAIIYAKKHNFKFAIVGTLIGVAVACVSAAILNYYLLIPAYTQIMPIEAILSITSAINPAADSLMGYVLVFAMPFTAAKLAIDAVIVFLLYKKLARLLHR